MKRISWNEKGNKNPETSVKYSVWKQRKPIVSVVENILLTKIQVPGKLTKID